MEIYELSDALAIATSDFVPPATALGKLGSIRAAKMNHWALSRAAIGYADGAKIFNVRSRTKWRGGTDEQQKSNSLRARKHG